MSEKCKTLMMPLEAIDLGDGQGYRGNDGNIQEFLASASPTIGFGHLGACDGWDGKGGVAAADGSAEQASVVLRRLAAVAQVEVVYGSSDIRHCRQRMAAVWSRLLTRLLLPLVDRSRGRLLRRSDLSAAFEFRSTLAAVRWAVDTQDQVEDRDADRSVQRVGLCIDIDAGEFADLAVPQRGENRITVESAACAGRAGEIWLTRQAHAFVAADIEFQASDQLPFGCAPRLDQERRQYQVRRRRSC